MYKTFDKKWRVKMMKRLKKTGQKALSLLLSLAMILSAMTTMIPTMEVKAAGYYSSSMYSVVHFD